MGVGIERRIEQLDQAIAAFRAAVDESGIDRIHRPVGAFGLAGSRKHRPALGNRVDRAFGVFPGAQRRAVVEPGAQVPIAIPGVVIDIHP